MNKRKKNHLSKPDIKSYRTFSVCLALVVAFMTLFGGFTFAVESTEEILTFDVTDDSGVLGNEKSKDLPQGTLATVAVGTNGPREGYIKYQVDGLKGKVTSAKLELSYTYGVADSAGTTSVYLTGTSWDEGTLTYSNRPVAMDDGNPEVLVATFDNPVAVVSGTPEKIEVDVSSAINGNGVYAFHFVSSAAQRTNFASKENETAPCAKLVITCDSSAANEQEPTPATEPTSGNPQETAEPTPAVEPTPSSTQETTEPKPTTEPAPTTSEVLGGLAKTVKVKAAEDAHVISTSAALNYGDAELIVLQSLGGNVHEPYFKFNVTGIDAPIRKAYLRVYISKITKGDPVTPFSVWTTGTNWQENTITWNSKPEILENVSVFNTQAVLGYWIEAEVTNVVKENGTYSFHFKSDDNKAQILMSSKDTGAYAPELEIIYGEGTLPERESMPADFGVVKTLTLNPEEDVCVNTGSADRTSKTLALNNSESPKEAYLSFDIWSVNTDINEAKLRLYYQGGNAGGKLSIYSTYNGWTGNSISWGNKPVPMPSKALGEQVLTEEAGWIEFDAKNYITGTGRYSFIVKSDTTSDVLITSNEAHNNCPELLIAYQNGVARDIVKEVLPSGKRVVERYSDTKLISMGIIDVTKAPYCADNTGNEDSTLAIQRAINEGRDARCVVYLPAGTYLVSDTLECLSPRYDNGTAKEVALGRTDFGNVLRGSSDLYNRSVIKLADKADGFDDPNDPRPVIHLWAIEGTVPNIYEKSNINYAQELNNIDINLNGNNGNAGAIGVDFLACEHSAMECVNVDATGAFSGFRDALGSGGAIHRISATGGRYGMYIPVSQPQATVSHGTFEGQTVACIYNNANGGPLVLVGAKLTPAPGANAIQCQAEADKSPFNAGLSMIDSIIEMPEGNTVPAIVSNRSVYMKNVYVGNAGMLVNINDAAGNEIVLEGNPKGWCKINEYAGNAHVPYGEQQAYNGETIRPDVIIINGEKQFTPYSDVEISVDVDSIPADLQSRHTWEGVFPWFDYPGILNAWDYGVTADGNSNNYTDQYEAIQKAIDDASVKNLPLFLPKGIYRISKSIELKANTQLVGASRNATIILPITGPDENPEGDFLDPNNPQPLIKTVDDANATTKLAFMRLFVSMPHIERIKSSGVEITDEIICTNYAVLWQTGRNSVVRGIMYKRGGKGSGGGLSDVPFFVIRGNGGGKFFILGVANATHMKPTYTQCLIDGTTEPIKIYHFQPQLGNAQANCEFGCEIRNASNVEIYGIKYEGSQIILYINGSKNIQTFGEGGGGSPEILFKVENSEDILFSSINPRMAKTSLGIGRDIIINDGNGTDDINQVLLYKTGSPESVAVSAYENIGTIAVPGDVKTSDWYYKNVNGLILNGILSPYQDGSFKPQENMLSGDFIKAVVAAMGYAERNCKDKPEHLIETAIELGIVKDKEFNNYQSPITRGQMARIVSRVISNEQSSSAISGNKKLIKDYESIPAEFKESVLVCFSEGIVMGYPDGEFKYALNATRAEAATIIMRMLNFKRG